MELPPPIVTQVAGQIAANMKLRPEQVPTVAWTLFIIGGFIAVIIARYTWRRILRRIRIILGLPTPEENISIGGGGAFSWMVALALGGVAYLLLSIIL